MVALKHKKNPGVNSDSKLSEAARNEKLLFVHSMAVNEYQILAKLDHPNILKLYEVFHDSQTKEVSIVTEFI
jgi:serine/threonine protein kinase